jgi:hypothetical protein
MEKKRMSTEKVVTTANDTNDAVAERILKHSTATTDI